MLVPVDTIPVVDLIRQLSVRPYDAWVMYEGKHIKNLPLDALVRSDSVFQLFWTCRLLEERLAFTRIVDNPLQLEMHSYEVIMRWARNRLNRVNRRISRLNIPEYKDTPNPSTNREDT